MENFAGIEIKTFLDIQFNDVNKARIINETQDNLYRQTNSDFNHRAQIDFYNYLKNGGIFLEK